MDPSTQPPGADGGNEVTGNDRTAAAEHMRRAAGFLARTDRNERLVAAARVARRLAPEAPVPELDVSARSRLSDRLYRLMSEKDPATTDLTRGEDPGTADRSPSATRELTLAIVAVWRALSSKRTGTTVETADVTILFTDLVGFSTWALHAGDERIIELIGEVNRVSSEIITAHRGRIVKSLGDGVMAVFADAAEAIHAAFELCGAVSAIRLDDYRPSLRAGLHTGSPTRVGGDFLGVDVNVAARVADAAGEGEVLATSDTLASADAGTYVRRRRRFRAKGTPKDLEVFAVIPRYED